jgi:hypothetical protein
VTKIFARHTVFVLGLVWMWLASASVLADDNKVYRLELGLQAGAGYYIGELAEHPFMSTSETYGIQARVKIDPRWSLQFKAQRQRVITKPKQDNPWGLSSDRRQTPMWHFDITGEYNFFRYGFESYDIRMHNITPFIFLGVGFTARNVLAVASDGYPLVGWVSSVDKNNVKSWKYVEPEFAMYIPVGVGMKWRFAPRCHLQLAWQHQIYVLNGDGLEGVYDIKKPHLLDDSYGMNGSNILNNDVLSTFTVGMVFEFAAEKKVCLHCKSYK